MRRIIKEIFNKEENILKEDIEKFIIESQLKESVNLEYKSIDNFEKGLVVKEKGGKKDKKEDILIKPLVAFLNKFSAEGGLLVLGIYSNDGIPQKIAAADKGLFTPEHLKSWIYYNISSVPPIKDYPDIDIKEIDAGKKSIFLIEIHPSDMHVVYFSKITNSVYIRRSDRSTTLSLGDIYKLVSEKVCPKIFIKINMEERKIEGPFIKMKLGLKYFNEGFRPGEWVRSTMSFKLAKGDLGKIKITPSSGWRKRKEIFEDFGFFQSDTWAKDIVYPKVSMSMGNITLNLEQNNELYLNILTYEREGSSFQTFLINSRGVISETKQFNAYF